MEIISKQALYNNNKQNLPMNEFSFQLFKMLQNSNNLVFSPASIYIALGMTSIGSSDKTLVEFQKVLKFNKVESFAENLKTIQSSLVKQGNGITTSFMNKIYLGIPKLVEQYQQLIQPMLQVVEIVDFTDFENIRMNINKQVEETTKQKIKDLLTPGSLNQYSRMVLVNAIYFKGDWFSKFDKKSTQKQNFKLEYEQEGQQIKTDIMYMKAKYDFYQNQDYKYVSIPYKGGEYIMEIILPNKTLKQFETTLTINTFYESRANKRNIEIKLYLPKFKIQPSESIKLKEILKQMGIQEAFENANFSQMDPDNSLFISDVCHKAMIEVNEDGAESAAATAVTMTLNSLPKFNEMNCNKPFIYTITHVPTNTFLFLGKLTNPSSN